jgi:glutaconyl-CoA/methylmalonyl-CoA decarboxylase subunit gamma
MKKFSFVINGNAYEVEVLGFEENIAKVEVNGTQYNVEVQKDLKMTKTPTLIRAESPKPKNSLSNNQCCHQGTPAGHHHHGAG